PLREKIAHLEQRALKAEAALADAKREGAIEALEDAAEVIPGSDSGIGAIDHMTSPPTGWHGVPPDCELRGRTDERADANHRAGAGSIRCAPRRTAAN